MEWPIQSLDLNPTEMVWGEFKNLATEGIFHGSVVQNVSKLMSDTGG